MSLDLDDTLTVAREAARETGEILLEGFQSGSPPTEVKEGGDVVTPHDRRADTFICESISDNFPNHGIDSEESPAKETDSPYVWRVDPLDGSVNYIRGVPMFSTSIALMEEGVPKMGVIHNPVTKNTYEAIDGQGAARNGQALSVSSRDDPSDSIVTLMLASHYDSRLRSQVAMLFDEVGQVAGGLRLWVSQALELAHIASGQLDGSVCLKTRGYSGASGILLVQEAGGRVTDIEGESFGPNSSALVASNGRIHAPLLEAIRDSNNGD